jgi:hypothetical protein
MYKFLCKAYETNHHFTLDFDAEELNGDCQHEVCEDETEEFEKNIFLWCEKFKKEL